MAISDPRQMAEEFVRLNNKLIKYDGEIYYKFDGKIYLRTHELEIKCLILDFLYSLISLRAQSPPKKKDIDEVEFALKATVFNPNLKHNTWIKKIDDGENHDFIHLNNGILNYRTNILYGHNHNFFSTACLNVDFIEDKTEAPDWENFLFSIWPDDHDSIATLQEICGLLITDITRYQKGFLLVGPARSGKGTILRVIELLVGRNNISNPTLSSISNQFGMASLIDKKAAVMTDARLGNRTDSNCTIENILRITGEDSITVPRKYQSDWEGKISARLVIATNEMPALFDSSNALANRFIVLQMTKSFLGNEDVYLFDKLTKELPAILNWSLAGLNRLIKRGHFLQPSSGADSINILKELGSPIENFINETCVLSSDATIACYELFNMWKKWCERNNYQHAGTAQTFGKSLKSNKPEIVVRRYPDSKKRYYQGIRQSPEYLLENI